MCLCTQSSNDEIRDFTNEKYLFSHDPILILKSLCFEIYRKKNISTVFQPSKNKILKTL